MPETRRFQFPDTRLRNLKECVRDISWMAGLALDYGVERAANTCRSGRRAGRYRREGSRRNFFPKIGCVFIHIPKTAGTSVHQFFSQIEAACEASSRSTKVLHKLTRRGLHKHIKAEELRKIAGPHLWQELYSFTFVRNPWDLMVSSYFWWMQRAHHFNPLLLESLLVRRMNGFDEFIRSYRGKYCINELEGTMSDWFTVEDKDIVSYVGTVETLEQDLSNILSEIGLKIAAVNMPHLNAARRAHYREYYTNETRDMVASRFADIIERFHYEF